MDVEHKIDMITVCTKNYSLKQKLKIIIDVLKEKSFVVPIIKIKKGIWSESKFRTFLNTAEIKKIVIGKKELITISVGNENHEPTQELVKKLIDNISPVMKKIYGNKLNKNIFLICVPYYIKPINLIDNNNIKKGDVNE